MSWNQTKRRWAALHEIETLANAGCTELPWNAEYAEIFGDRDELAAALRYRWNLTLNAQLDDHLSTEELLEHRRLLEERNAGVLRMLAAHVNADGDLAGSAEAGLSLPVFPSEPVRA